MDNYKNVILEAGINHLGKISEAKKILNFFLNSKFKSLSFMVHSKDFYKKMNKKINYKLPISFYSEAIKLAHKKNKRIGLAVCDIETFKPFHKINFDFYKLLGISINNKKLIYDLGLKKKHVYISCAQGNNFKINRCLKYFKKKKNLSLIYTMRSYDPAHLDLHRIGFLKKKYKMPVGYGHHYKTPLPLYLSTFFSPNFYFIYIKNSFNKSKLIPDNEHAFFTNNLKKNLKELNEASIMVKKKKKVNIKAFIKSVTKKI